MSRLRTLAANFKSISISTHSHLRPFSALDPNHHRYIPSTWQPRPRNVTALQPQPHDLVHHRALATAATASTAAPASTAGTASQSLSAPPASSPWLSRIKALSVLALGVGGTAALTSYLVYSLHGREPDRRDASDNTQDEAKPGQQRSHFNDYVPRSFLSTCLSPLVHMPVPSFCRVSFFSFVARVLGCDAHTLPAEAAGYRAFHTVSDFVARRTDAVGTDEDLGKEAVYGVDGMDGLLFAPCDGVVEAVGTAGAFGTLRVKGETHVLREVLGAGAMDPLSSTAVDVREATGGKSGTGGDLAADADDTELAYVVLALHARDPHSFAAPVDRWVVSEHRHVSGRSLFCPGALRAASWPSKNERVAVIGRWPHGLMAMVAIAAPLRRSIVLATPHISHPRPVSASRDYNPPWTPRARQHVGHFRAGSAIVVAFEAPTPRFSVKAGDRVRKGQPLASVGTDAKAKTNRTAVEKGGHSDGKDSDGKDLGATSTRSWWAWLGFGSSDEQDERAGDDESSRKSSEESSRDRFRRAW